MNIPINFVNRSNIATSNNKSNKVDAAKLIEHFLSLHPSNRVKPNSLLYDLAVRQYNENIKNTLVRPDVPKWFCGKVNPATNELINIPSDQDLRASAGVVSDPLTLQLPSSAFDSNGYLIDNCLYLGTPGSYDYTQCVEGQDVAQVEMLISDWLAGMESVGGLGTLAYGGLGGSGEGGGGGANPGGNISMSDAEAHKAGDFRLYSASINGGTANMSWQNKGVMGGSDGKTDSTYNIIWKSGSGWAGGYFEYIRIGQSSGSISLQNVINGYGSHRGELVGLYISARDNSKRSDIIFTKWN